MEKKILAWQENNWRKITHSELKQAYLFNHVEKDGTEIFAREFVNKILCERNDEFACGVCASCQLSGNHPDLLHLNKQPIKVDDVHAITDFIIMQAFGKNKVIFIENVHFLNNFAANAILKILEEPPENTVFVATTYNKRMLISTVLSRFMNINMNQASKVQAENFLLSSGVPAASISQLLEIASPVYAKELYNNNYLERYQEFLRSLDDFLNNRLSLLEFGKICAQLEFLHFVNYLMLFLKQLLKQDINLLTIQDIFNVYDEILLIKDFYYTNPNLNHNLVINSILSKLILKEK